MCLKSENNYLLDYNENKSKKWKYPFNIICWAQILLMRMDLKSENNYLLELNKDEPEKWK